MSKRTMKIGLSTLGTLLGFSTLTVMANRFLGVQGAMRGVLVGVLGVLGLAAAFLVFRYLSKAIPEERPEEQPERQIDEVFSEAGSKLRSARVEGGKIGRLPILLFLGPSGGTKTTLIERSGIDPELLAGEVYGGESVVATKGANIWLGSETLFVEAAGGLLDDEPRWSRLIRHLRPARLAAVLGRGRQPARAAVVCFPCEELRGSSRSDEVTAAARLIRERLHELSRSFGIRLPVYVLFTKVDEIGHFEPFVHRFTDAEVREVLGATLPIDRDERGVYAEAESDRLGSEFDRLFRSLALRRPELLQRESEARARGGIYEFPRELLKTRDAAVRFLVELGRPSRLAVSPIVRGFYFTGVRPVVPEDAAASEPARGSAAEDAPVGATAVFDPAAIQAARSSSRVAAGSGRVPQWTFVRRLFRDLLLGDRVAIGVAGGGAGVNLLRRALAGGALALGLICVVGVFVSWRNNERLANDVRFAMESAPAAGELTDGEPSQNELRDLARLGEQVTLLREHDVDGPRLGLRWGLYKGRAILDPARDLYFRLFEDPMAIPARNAVIDDLDALPAASDTTAAIVSDYDSTYDALKAYLIMTRHPEFSQVDFLAPTLTRYRVLTVERDSAWLERARAQFGVYAAELPYGNPYVGGGWAADETLIRGAREYLNRFAGEETAYRRVIARASDEYPAVSVSGDFVRSDRSVEGAFTRDGWLYIQSRLDEDIRELLAGEEWVNPRTFSETELDQLEEVVWRRYEQQYVREWLALLQGAEIRGLGPLGSSARTLEALSDASSPLLELLATVAYHTNVRSDTIFGAFDPVRAVMPLDSTGDIPDRLIVPDVNEGYVSALGAAFRAVDEAAAAGGAERREALARAASEARTVGERADEFRREFESTERAQATGDEVRRLLRFPAERVRGLAEGFVQAELRGKLADFCRRFDGLTSRYPFNPDAGRDNYVTIAEVDELLKPGEGVLWTYPQSQLGDVVEGRPGNYFVPSDVSPRPDDAFVDFLNRAAEIAEALYDDSGQAGVRFQLDLEPLAELTQITMYLNSRAFSWDTRNTGYRPMEWEGERAESARIVGVIDGAEEELLREDGSPWALYRLLQNADWTRRSSREWSLSWRLGQYGITLRGELSLVVDFPILHAEELDLSCVSNVRTR